MAINEKGHECCPDCNSSDFIVWDGFDGGYDNGEAREHVRCSDCSCTWDKIYHQHGEEKT